MWRLRGPGLSSFAAILPLGLACACVHVPASQRASVRRDAYLAAHRELPPSIAKAIIDGHVVGGMDRDQVKAVLGEPLKTSIFGRKDGTRTEVWIFPAVRLHQDRVGGEHGTLFRLVFIDGRLAVMEPV